MGDYFVTIIDSLLSIKHQTITVATVKQNGRSGKMTFIKRGVSPPRSDKYKPGVDCWLEYLYSWLTWLGTLPDAPKKHYICIRRFPSQLAWVPDEQEMREIKSLRRIVENFVKKYNGRLIPLSYREHESFVETVQEFVDLKEMETERLRAVLLTQ